jgi:DNA modification methylase
MTKAATNSLSSPKRRSPERSGLHAWHSYYAGYSEQFVAEALASLGLRTGDLVLDPMNGSGTTTLVAQRKGHLALGVELNPVMAILSRAKDAAFKGQEELVGLAKNVADRARRRGSVISSIDDKITAWIPGKVIDQIQRIDFEISELAGKPLLALHQDYSGIIDQGDLMAGGRPADFLKAALLITARNASTAGPSKNPTWIKPGEAEDVNNIDVFPMFVDICTSMLADVSEAFEERPPEQRLLVLESDARDLPLTDNSVDAIVTSPPYLTRIDYAVGTTPELIALGYNSLEDLKKLRKEIMGSTCVTGGSYELKPVWGRTCLKTIGQISKHHSVSSEGYYRKMHVQYFRDAEALLRQFLRVLKPKAPCVLVVQDSWYKDILVPLGTIYKEMARKLGAKAVKTLRSELVGSHLGLINTRARRYQKGALYEHVILFRSE